MDSPFEETVEAGISLTGKSARKGCFTTNNYKNLPRAANLAGEETLDAFRLLFSRSPAFFGGVNLLSGLVGDSASLLLNAWES